MREEDGPFAVDEVVEVDVPVSGLGLEVGGDGTETQPERTSQYASVESTAQYLLVSQEASVFCHMHTCSLMFTHLGCSAGVLRNLLKIGDACRLAKLPWVADSRVARRAPRAKIDAMVIE